MPLWFFSGGASVTMETQLLQRCWVWKRMMSPVLDKLQVTYLRDTQRHFSILVGDRNPE